jgi:putative ABC transport system permease protein
MNAFLTAARGIRYRWKRYLFVCVALSFGFAMILVLSGLSGGMTKNVDIAAARRYGGNLFVLGHQQTPYYTPVIRDDAALLAAVRQAGISASLVSRRTSYFENSQIFFNGYAARQKVVTGIDWTVEAGVFRNLDFAAGSFEGMAGSSGILISSVTARQLQARVGDDVVLSADTMTGQRNTVRLVIKGIFVDSSIFGAYVSYMDLAQLNRLIGLAPGEYTILGIHLTDPRSAARDAVRLHASLSGAVPMFGPVETQQDLWVKLGEQWTGVKYAVLTLGGYLSDLKDLTAAVDLGLYLLLGLMLVIITIGISTTFRVMVHERTGEFGTMRALGMKRSGVLGLIMAETILLGILCVVLGSMLGFPLLVLVGSVPAPRIPGFDIFLRRGVIGWHLSPVIFPLDALSAVAAILVGGIIPARRASRIEPAHAQRAL